MCVFQSTPKPPKIDPPAPPPPTPPPPPAPPKLPDPTPLSADKEDTKPKVKYGRKKSASIRAMKGTDSLRIPLNNPTAGGDKGGLNV